MLDRGYLSITGGRVLDPEGRAYGTASDGYITWYDGRDCPVRMPIEDLRSSERGAEPGQATITTADGTACVCAKVEEEEVTILRVPPERTGGRITDLEHILDYSLGDELRRNVWEDYHSGYLRIDLGVIGGSGEVPIEKAIIPMRRYVEAQELATWGRAYNVPKCDMESYLEHLANGNIRNRFLETIRGCDPTHPRYAAAYSLFRAVGLTAPDVDPEEEQAYLEWTNRAVLLGAIERQFGPAKIDICPCIVGAQGTGKTTLCQFLGNDWYKASVQDVKDPRQFMESVNGAVIAEFREGIQTMDPETLKNFLDTQTMQYRRPYERAEKEYNIPFITLITTNDPQPLLDQTGARRFLPMLMTEEARIEKPWELTRDDWLAVWGRALDDYERGERWRDGFDAGIERTAERMRAYASRAPAYYDEVIEILEEWPNVGARIIRRELLQKMEARLGAVGLKQAKEALRKNPGNFGLELSRTPAKLGIDGKSERFYRRIKELRGPRSGPSINPLPLFCHDYKSILDNCRIL